jgi:hypothetical protein
MPVEVRILRLPSLISPILLPAIANTIIVIGAPNAPIAIPKVAKLLATVPTTTSVVPIVAKNVPTVATTSTPVVINWLLFFYPIYYI